MTQTDSDNIETRAASTETPTTAYRSSAMAWVSLLIAVVAWLILVWSDGYIALATAVAALIVGIIGARRRSPGAKRLAVTAIIAALVLIVVVASYLVVLKVVMK